jgi:hypothetical protein
MMGTWPTPNFLLDASTSMQELGRACRSSVEHDFPADMCVIQLCRLTDSSAKCIPKGRSGTRESSAIYLGHVLPICVARILPALGSR